MTDFFRKGEYEEDVQGPVVDESNVPDAVGVYERPEESGLSPALIAVIALILLVVAAAVVLLLVL